MSEEKRVLQVTVTELDGTVLDRFDLAHWRNDAVSEDAENYGSPASESLLVARIQALVQSPVSEGRGRRTEGQAMKDIDFWILMPVMF